MDAASSLPTKFLVQAQLISNNDDFATVSLNDLAASWHRLVQDEKLRISLVLELVYYRRLPGDDNVKGKRHVVSRNTTSHDEDFTEAIAASCNQAGPSDCLLFQPVSRSDVVAFQLALERSLQSQFSPANSTSSNMSMSFF